MNRVALIGRGGKEFSMETADSGEDPPRGKIARLLQRTELDDIGDRLVASWRADGEPHRSLRELADFFNLRLLEARMQTSGIDPLEGEIENIYRLLTENDVAKASRAQAESRLTREGVDVDALLDDFVSHQAVHTYLRKHRGVEPPGSKQSAEDAVEGRTRAIQRLRSRLQTVTRQGLENLVDAGYLSLGSFEIFVNVTVYCSDCGTSVDVGDLLDRKSCDC